jgi:hypothetical protein
MECPESVPCDLCGYPTLVVFNRGFDKRGRRILKPALVESEDGLYLFVECPVHGRRAQAIAPSCDACLGKGLYREVEKTRSTDGRAVESDKTPATRDEWHPTEHEWSAPRRPK